MNYLDLFEEDETISVDDVFDEIMEYCSSDVPVDNDYYLESGNKPSMAKIARVILGMWLLTSSVKYLGTGISMSSYQKKFEEIASRDPKFIKFKDLEPNYYDMSSFENESSMMRTAITNTGKKLGKYEQAFRQSKLYVFSHGNNVICAFAKFPKKWDTGNAGFMSHVDTSYKKYEDYYVANMFNKCYGRITGYDYLKRCAKKLDIDKDIEAALKL